MQRTHAPGNHPQGFPPLPTPLAAEVVAPAIGQRSAVVFHPGAAPELANRHDLLAKASVAQSLARLMDWDFAGPYTPERDAAALAAGQLYLVPGQTLLREAAQQLGVHSPQALFGGVVPQPFVATKAISHPLWRSDAPAPTGWSLAHGAQVRGVVLPGYTVFSHEDGRQAGRQLLENGPLRLKDVGGVGGNGQTVVADVATLDALLADWDPATLAREGLVLEHNLAEVNTLSVGQVQVGPWTAAYVGTQQLTRNHQGQAVYGGSRLQVVRGGFDTLWRQPLDPEVRTGLEQALVYHHAAFGCFEGLFASRCNYDVAQGRDDQGRWWSGVLEQSWRIGGASGAELAALHAFRQDPGLQQLTVSSHEVYADMAPPPGAVVHYNGIDPEVGRLVKYVQLETGAP